MNLHNTPTKQRHRKWKPQYPAIDKTLPRWMATFLSTLGNDCKARCRKIAVPIRGSLLLIRKLISEHKILWMSLARINERKGVEAHRQWRFCSQRISDKALGKHPSLTSYRLSARPTSYFGIDSYRLCWVTEVGDNREVAAFRKNKYICSLEREVRAWLYEHWA